VSAPKRSLEEIVASLRAEGSLSDEGAECAARLIESMRDVQPWYIRAMVGFGAWLASLLLIGFVGGMSIAMDGGYLIVGLGLIAAALVLRKRFDTDFVVQSTLAVSLAGQVIFVYGIAKFVSSVNIELTLAIIVIVNVILFVVFPDRIHRVLSIFFASGALAVLLYFLEFNSAIPLLGPAFAAALIFVHKHQVQLVANGFGVYVRPLMSGLMLSAFGFLILSTIYVLPELGIDFEFYPRPWISTVLFGVLILYLGAQLWPQVLDGGKAIAPQIIQGLMLVVIAAAWAAPGLLLALVVTMLGASFGNRTFVRAGIAFLAVFIGAYFYGIEITMLTKSITLVGTGVAVLLARWLILKFVPEVPGEPANA